MSYTEYIILTTLATFDLRKEITTQLHYFSPHQHYQRDILPLGVYA